MRSIFTNIFICIFYIHVINGNPPSEERGFNDLIENIPSLEQLPDAEMFAGHLIPINPNNITESSDKRIYYWLNRSQDPESKTLIIWLNGGPGCSSLFGLFAENGPLMLDPETGGLTEREYSWNRFAHTLYFELPTSVGFSYTRDGDRHQVMNENTTVADIVGVFYRFLEEHERYKNFDIYLAGESYAGMWIPQAAQQLIQFNNHLNIKGIILGNPKLNSDMFDKNMPKFAYYHGLISKHTFDFLTTHNCMDLEAMMGYEPNIYRRCSREMDHLLNLLNTDVNNGGLIDRYHVTRDCWKKNSEHVDRIEMKLQMFNEKTATSEQRKQNEEYENLLDIVKQKPLCGAFPSNLENFLSFKDVQEAIHANYTDEYIGFTVCSESVMWRYQKQKIDMSPYIKDLITKYNTTVLLYYGDQDLACNFLDGQDFVAGLGLEKTSKWQPYFIEKNNGLMKKVHGYTSEYAHRLKYATIKGAGHMAPSDKPEATYNLVSNWIASNRDN